MLSPLFPPYASALLNPKADDESRFVVRPAKIRFSK